jgi:hypothetical protein
MTTEEKLDRLTDRVAPGEYPVIESSNPKVRGFDGGVRPQVEYLEELAAGKRKPPKPARPSVISAASCCRAASPPSDWPRPRPA